ncbi:MAG: CDP-glucose 4,6-dehydratase [bacterium]|nr:CDP-glucose 4,6-dehydratase [bacterium]
MFGDVFRGRRVLVTGHNGFKGAWLSLWLHELGARVTGLALPPEPSPTLHEILHPDTFEDEFVCDIRDADALKGTLARAAPEMVFHLAAQALVRRSYREPRLTFETNALGTHHLLEAVHELGVTGPVIVATTDKCYENHGEGRPFRVGDPLGGRDPYSMSKAAAELVVASFRSSFLDGPADPPVATVRAGNVVGGGDYGEDRLLPDAVRALLRGDPVPVRNPRAVRPWQHVLDCLSGYLRLAQELATTPRDGNRADAFNIGPAPEGRLTASEVVEAFLSCWPGRWEDRSEPGAPYEAPHLELDTAATTAALGWTPAWDATEAVARSADWYRARHEAKRDDLHELCLEQIRAWTVDATPATRGQAT